MMFTYPTPQTEPPISVNFKNYWGFPRFGGNFDIIWLGTEIGFYSDYNKIFLPSFNLCIFNFAIVVSLEFMKKESYALRLEQGKRLKGKFKRLVA